MTGWAVAWLIGTPLLVASCLVASEEIWRGLRWVSRLRVGVEREDFIPPYVGLTVPSGRVVRLLPLPTARDKRT